MNQESSGFYWYTCPQRPPIILLKQGTDTSQGKPQIISNINACEVVVGAIGSTLGPRGMDKLIVDSHGEPRKLVVSGGSSYLVYSESR